MSTHGPPPRHREWKIGCKVYIGNLADGASKADIEDAFSKYGPLRNVWVARNPPGFAFVEFEDNRDAEDACRQLDGTRIAGARIKAEMSHGRSRRGRGGGGGGGGGGGPGGFRGGPPNYAHMEPYGAHGGARGHYGGGPPRGGHYNGDYPYGGMHGGGGARSGHHGDHGHHLDRAPVREPHTPRQRSRSNSPG